MAVAMADFINATDLILDRTNFNDSALSATADGIGSPFFRYLETMMMVAGWF